MGFFKEEDVKEIKKILADKLTDEVSIDLFTKKSSKLIIQGEENQDCPYCESVVEMMNEFIGMSDKIKLNVYDIKENEEEAKKHNIENVPALVFNGKKEGTLIFYGIPTGYEFATMLETLTALSSDKIEVFSEDMQNYIKGIEKEITFKVFVTPSCPYCPSAAISAMMAAKLNKNIRAEVYEVSEFQEIGNKYKVEGVPKTVINEKAELVGAYPENMLKEKLEAEVL